MCGEAVRPTAIAGGTIRQRQVRLNGHQAMRGWGKSPGFARGSVSAGLAQAFAAILPTWAVRPVALAVVGRPNALTRPCPSP